MELTGRTHNGLGELAASGGWERVKRFHKASRTCLICMNHANPPPGSVADHANPNSWDQQH